MTLQKAAHTTAVGFSRHCVEIAELLLISAGGVFFFCTPVILLVNAIVHKYVV